MITFFSDGHPPLLVFGMSLCHSDPIHAPSPNKSYVYTPKLLNSQTPKKSLHPFHAEMELHDSGDEDAQ